MLESMQKPKLTFLLLCVMFCTPFMLLGTSYRGLPLELPVLRLWIGHWVLFAPKSLFMVFRVSLMNLIHGLLAYVMFSLAPAFKNTERRTGYSNMFLTLLFAIVLKSNFEAMELSVLAVPHFFESYARWFGFGALTSVLGGIGLALFRGRKAPLPWPELRLTTRYKFVLAGLLAVYVAIVVVSLLDSDVRRPGPKVFNPLKDLAASTNQGTRPLSCVGERRS